MTRSTRVLAVTIAMVGGACLDVMRAAEPATAQVAFVTSAAQSGLLQVEAARLAVAVSKDPAVKEFAYRMIYDYQKMNEDLARTASHLQMTAGAALDAEHAAQLEKLQNSPAEIFDSAYVAMILAEDAAAVARHESNLLNPEPEIQVFASYNLPRMREHKRLATELQAAMSGRSATAP